MIKNIVFLLLAFLMITSCKSVEKYNLQITKKHTITNLRSDIDKAYKKLQRDHPRLYQYIPKEQLDYKFDSLKQTITTPLNSKQFYKKLAPVVKAVGQGHIAVILPTLQRTRKERKPYRDKKFSFNTFDFDYIENRLFVTRALNADTVFVGSEVLKIEEETPQQLIEEYNTYIASDGYNTTLFESYVGKKFLRFYFRDKGFQDSVKVQFKIKDSIFHNVFKWEDKKEITTLKNKARDSTTKNSAPRKLTRHEKQKRRLARKQKREKNKKYGYIASKDQYTRNLEYVGENNEVALIKIRSFTNGDYKTFYEDSFKTLDSLGIQHLILDLRDNGGGRIAEINELYKYLALEPFTFINPSEVTTRTPVLNMLTANANPFALRLFGILASPAILIHNLIKTKKEGDNIYYTFRQSKPQQPYKNNFKGNIYVLINGNSFSASSILSTHLKATNRATFIGQETGGAYNGTVAGFFKVYELPNTKVTLRMGLMQIETPYNLDPDGYGVVPDIEIKPTYANFANNNDAMIQWVLANIAKNN